MKRLFKIGEKIFDDYDMRWGKILLIGGADHDDVVDVDCVITYKPIGGLGECQTEAGNCYQIAKGKRFQGHQVCVEHFVDIDYPYYCPDLQENCYTIELD